MKLIFLDIDGVFNSEKYYRQRDGFTPREEAKEFDPGCVKLFNKIFDTVEADIVVSSTWRRGDLGYLQELFKCVGIKGKVVGETVKLRWNCDYPGVSIPRGLEIKQYYANKHDFTHYNWDHDNKSNLKSYVIVDDDSDMLYEQRNNFVNVNSEIGLTTTDVQKAIDILKKEF